MAAPNRNYELKKKSQTCTEFSFVSIFKIFIKHKKSDFFHFSTPLTLLPDVAALLKLP